MRQKLAELKAERERLIHLASPKAVERQHSRGKMTARERINYFYDQGTFTEHGLFAKPRITGFDLDQQDLTGDGVITGSGDVNGRPVYAYAQDFTIAGGSQGSVHGKKTLRIMKQALKARVPCIHMIDSGGVRIQDAVTRDFNDSYQLLFLLTHGLFRSDPADRSFDGSLCGRSRLLPHPDGFSHHGEEAPVTCTSPLPR